MIQLLSRFSLVGVVNTLIGYGVIVGCLFAGLGDYAANLVGYGVGLFVSFTLNRQFVFGVSGSPSRREVNRFLIVFALAYSANLGTLWLTQMMLGGGNPLAQIPALAVYSGVFFILSHRFVFANGGRKLTKP